MYDGVGGFCRVEEHGAAGVTPHQVARDGFALRRIEPTIQKTGQGFFIRARIERRAMEGEAGSRHVPTFRIDGRGRKFRA